MGDIYCDINASGTDAGTSWTNAFDNIASIRAAIILMVAGETAFVKGGTYTLTAALVAGLDGTQLLPIKLVGVKATTTNEPPVLADHAFGNDRPLFVCAAWTFTFDNYWHVKNLRVTITTTTGLKTDIGGLHYNNSVVNSSGTASRAAAYSGGNQGRIIGCHLESTNGDGIIAIAEPLLVQNNYIKASNKGINSFDEAVIIGNIIYNCTTGIDGFASASFQTVCNNSIDLCTTGYLSGNLETPSVTINNSFSNCTDAFLSNGTGAIRGNMFFDYNNWYNNTHDMSWDNGTSEDNSMKGVGATAVDPKFTDAAADDFTLQSDSLLRNAGMPLLNGIG